VTQTERLSVDITDPPRPVEALAMGAPAAEVPAVALPEVISFAAVFRREYRGLVAMAWGLTGSRETAEDLAQEALLNLHRRWDRGEPIDDPAAYVRRTCSNLAVSWIRRRMAETRALLRFGAPTGESPNDVETEIFWSEVRHLPRRQAQAVALFYGYGMSVAEVSQTLQMAEGTAKTHLHRGRKALAARLGVAGPDEEGVR
jgi:RNA polymerase sigma-70 factor (ECF subfamily)